MRTTAAVLYEMGKPGPYGETKPLAVDDVELEGPGPGEVLVEIAAAGLCHSDLSVIDGARPRPMPMVLGHEASGVVRECGSGAGEFKPGDHVVFSYMPACGRCVYCASGRPALCEKGAASNAAGTLLCGAVRFKDGKGRALNHHLGVSAFSRSTVAAQESLVRIDKDFPLERAALFGCAVMTGVGAVANTARVEAGAPVAVFGMGGVGLSAVLGARLCGAHPVVAIDVLDAKLEQAKRMGATHTVKAGGENVVEAVKAATGGGAQYAFEAVGNEKVMAQAYAATRRGGTTVAVGLAHPSKQFSVQAVSLVGEERTVKGSYMGSCVPRRDLPRFLELYRAGKLPADLLLSRTIELGEINAAFDALHSGEAVRQVIRFE